MSAMTSGGTKSGITLTPRSRNSRRYRSMSADAASSPTSTTPRTLIAAPVGAGWTAFRDACSMRALVIAAIVLATSSPGAFTERSDQSLPFAFNQGVARVDGGWIFSGTDSPIPGTDVLERTDDDLNVLTAQPLPIPSTYRAQGYDHVGDVDVTGGYLYVPFEQPTYDLGHQVTAWYDPTTLAFVDAVELPQHENSFVTIDEATMTAYTMDHFDGDALLRYDVRGGWKPPPPPPPTMTPHHTQGAAGAAGAVGVSTSAEHHDGGPADLAPGGTTGVGTLGHDGLE